MLHLACFALLGFITGWISFAALWQSVRHRTTFPTHLGGRFKVSPLLRAMLVVLSLSTATLAGPGSLIASLCGILVARTLIIRKILGEAGYV